MTILPGLEHDLADAARRRYGQQPMHRAGAVSALSSVRMLTRPRRWLRLSLAGVACVALAAVIIGVSGTLGGSGARVAWAKEVISRATAYLRSGAGLPLYSDAITIGRSSTGRTVGDEAITWQYGNEVAETTWSLRPRRHLIEETVVRGRRIDIFVAANNTIQESLDPAREPIGGYFQILSPLTQLGPKVVQQLHLTPGQLAAGTAGPAQVDRLMIALIHMRGVRVHHAMLRAKPAIRLSDPNWSGTIYLDPRTYAPRAIQWTHALGTNRFGNSMMIINSYRTLEPSQATPERTVQPEAPIPPRQD